MYYRKPSNNFVDGLSFYSPNKFSLLTKADTQFRIFQPKIPQNILPGTLKQNIYIYPTYLRTS